MTEKNEHRLFKVAKELNRASDILVEYLKKEGLGQVSSDLNARINEHQYEALLKHYASDKYTDLMRQKAEEQKKHTLSENEGENSALNKTETPVIVANPPIPKPLTESISPKYKTIGKVETKIEGKVDLELLRRKSPKPEPKKEEPVVEIPAPVVEMPPEIVEEKPTLVPEKRHEKRHDKTSVKPKIEKTETPTEKEVSEIVPEKEEIEEEDLEVIRASAPPLSGLKVLGKISLEDPTKKKKEEKKQRERVEKRRGLVKSAIPEKDRIKDKQSPQVDDKRKPFEKREETGVNKERTPYNNNNNNNNNNRNNPNTGNNNNTGNNRNNENRTNNDRNRTPNLTPNNDRNKVAANTERGVNNRPNTEYKTPIEPGKIGEIIDLDDKQKRKRKRKKTPAVGETQTQLLNKDKKPGRKEKPDEKAVQKNVNSTLQEMQRTAGRTRQMTRRQKRDDVARKREERHLLAQEDAKILRITEFITANEFANLMDVSVNEVIKKCWQLGKMVNINQRLDAEELTIIAEEYGFEIEFINVTEEEFEEEEVDGSFELETRTPVITVMGHVDHGKTTLLDYLRMANVAASEAGGITQHIGAYQVQLKSGHKVTFLDTPGHEAFTAMRARGTKVTDVAIIVIAADDAVMPTTKEAISHAQAAGVPMVFAINKIDKPGADPERIRTQLAQMNLLVEEWGGKYQCQEISAKKGIGVDELLDKVILEAEVLDLKASPKRHASGSIIESRLDKGRGNVVTILVQNGTLRIGDTMVAGIFSGKVRSITNQKGERIQEAGPSMPVQITGISGSPTAGDRFQVYEEDARAKEIATKRQELYREQQLRQTKRITLEEIGRRKLLGNFRELNIVIKGDVDGSVEALSGALLKLSTPDVSVNIILKGTGAINEGDVLLAAASDAFIIAFNVRPNVKARDLAEKEGVNIRNYSIIYNAIDDVTAALEGMLAPEMQEEIIGTVEVRDVFRITKVGNVAGCYVTSGKIERNNPIRVLRDNVVMVEATISSLKRFKEDVKEVSTGYECGIQIQGFGDIQAGDVIESYKVKEVKRKLSE